MKKQQLLLSEVPYGSLLVYSPRGTSKVSRDSQRFVRNGVKFDRPGIIERAGLRLKENLSESILSDYFGEDVALVPVPGHAPRKDKDTLWPALRICEELLSRKLCKEILPIVERVHPVLQSSKTPSGEMRPSPEEHAASLLVKTIIPPPRITLVDDFITRGSTLLAVFSLFKAQYPGVELKAFALVRTISSGEIEEIINPTTGVITYKNGVLVRVP